MKNLSLLLSILFSSGCGAYNIGVADGSNGRDGLNGKDADPLSFQFIRFSSDTAVCLAGSGVIIQVLRTNTLSGTSVDSQSVICDGIGGSNGEVGATGPQGLPGANGEDGEDGAAAPSSPYQVTQIIDPCGDAPGIFDEVFLKLANGALLASFSDNANGQNTRLSLLVPGNYMTTDGSNCHVHVDGSGLVTW